jgi:hypothetical protein
MEGLIMLRQSDINNAFRESSFAILRATSTFTPVISSLVGRGIHLSYSEANRWIERYQSCFADKTPDHTENRL